MVLDIPLIKHVLAHLLLLEIPNNQNMSCLVSHLSLRLLSYATMYVILSDV